ncbi:trypsin-like serine protease [Yoonia sp.]|uniref:trypsin-like serine protease n=1 Tax=Yoonia sp. TaxID=2212373 RepID=UPI002FD915AA
MLLSLLAAGCGSSADRVAPVPVAAPVPVLLQSDLGTVCNAVRLNADTVATAAHCLEEGASFTLNESGFVLPVEASRLHPAYPLADLQNAARFDLAKLSVAAPLGRGGRVVILPVEPGPVDIVAVTQAGATRIVRCQYLGRSGTLVELACAVDLGWSGAPVVQNGALVGILSARGRSDRTDIVQMTDATLLQSF